MLSPTFAVVSVWNTKSKSVKLLIVPKSEIVNVNVLPDTIGTRAPTADVE